MYLLDTNVVSERMRPLPDARVIAWFDAQPTDELWICITSAGELRLGAALLPDGKRKASLVDRVEHVLVDDFAGRCLPFSCTTSKQYARIVAMRLRAGRPISSEDAQIAAVAREQGLILVNRNGKDFDDLALTILNPWID